MKVIVLACCVALANGIYASRMLYKPQFRERKGLHRMGRDVSELTAPPYDYLPPTEKFELPVKTTMPEDESTSDETTETTTIPASTRLDESGYHYRVAHFDRKRLMRDVPHLATQYLPPPGEAAPPASEAASQPPPNQTYLPPDASASTVSPPTGDYLPPADINDPKGSPLPFEYDDTEAVEAATVLPKVTSDYLPPPAVVERVAPLEEDQVVTEPISDGTTTTIATPEEEPQSVDEQQDSAILADDGYHYKQPTIEPTELGSFRADELDVLDKNSGDEKLSIVRPRGIFSDDSDDSTGFDQTNESVYMSPGDQSFRVDYADPDGTNW